MDTEQSAGASLLQEEDETEGAALGPCFNRLILAGAVVTLDPGELDSPNCFHIFDIEALTVCLHALCVDCPCTWTAFAVRVDATSLICLSCCLATRKIARARSISPVPARSDQAEHAAHNAALHSVAPLRTASHTVLIVAESVTFGSSQ